MTAAEKLISVERQITDCERGKATSIICPYCGAENTKEQERLCCEPFGAAVMAVLNRKDLQDQLETVSRIAEKAAMN